jgi:SH3-like domain-containing protein
MARLIRYSRLAILLILFDVALAHALDQILLKNGKRLTGEIIEQDKEGVRILMAGIKIRVYFDEIDSVIREGGKPPSGTPGESKKPTPTPRTEPNPTPVMPTLTPDPALSLPADATAARLSIPRVISATEAVAPFPYPGQEPLIPLAIPTGRFHTVSRRMVRLREGPSIDYPTVGTLNQGDMLLELEEEDSWYHVELPDGKDAWVFAELTEPMETKVMVVKGLRVNFRAKPGKDSTILGQVDKGDILIQISEKDDWASVRDLAGNSGWIAKQYLDPITDLRALRSPVVLMGKDANEAYLSQALTVSRSPSKEAGRRTIDLTVHDDNLLRGGQIVLLAIRKQPREKGERRSTLFYSPELTWQHRFLSKRDLEDLGFSIELMETAREVVVGYLRGAKRGGEWCFSVDLDEKEMPANRVAIVVQQGLQRGACVVLPSE